MSNLNWGMITCGETFEALVTSLVYFEDPKARLFGRRGKDGGQDALSGDGTLVYQAKFHEQPTMGKVLADIRREAKKIQDYRQPGHQQYDQWKVVTSWRLVTNYTFNGHGDHEQWADEVVPLFQKMGIEADFWHRTDLEVRIQEHPELRSAFFEGENRVFLSIPEALKKHTEEQRLPDQALSGFVGRKKEWEEVQRFLGSEQRFLLASGPGGVGKSRTLLEFGTCIAAKGSMQVFWANNASMAASDSWFEAIVPERPTLLLMDEPDSPELLKRLQEQLSARAQGWKVLVAARSTHDLAIKPLVDPKFGRQVQRLELSALSKEEAEEMCATLLKVTYNMSEAGARELAEKVVKHVGCFPIWITLSVWLLQRDGGLNKLPTEFEETADRYLEKVLPNHEDATILLRQWVALLGHLNWQDDAMVAWLATQTGHTSPTKVRDCLNRLVQSGSLIAMGSQEQVVEVKPDVLRDRLRAQLLTAKIPGSKLAPSDEAKKVIGDLTKATLGGELSGVGRVILESLARTGWLLREADTPVPLMAGFYKGIRDGLSTCSAFPLKQMLDVLASIAAYHPAETVRLLTEIRNLPVESQTLEGLWKPYTIDKDDVVLALSRPLYRAATAATEDSDIQAIFREFCILAEEEGEISHRRGGKLPNDGDRTAGHLASLIHGGPTISGDYLPIAKQEIDNVLNSLAREAPSPGTEALALAILSPVLSIERSFYRTENWTVHYQHGFIRPDHLHWGIRATVQSRIREFLSDPSVPPGSRKILWAVLDKGHGSLVRARIKKTEFQEEGEKPSEKWALNEVLDDLNWAYRALSNKGADLEELSQARHLWDWHLNYDKDPMVRAAAKRLESLYLQNDLAAEFKPLFDRHDWKTKEQRQVEKAEHLATTASPDAIRTFLNRAIRFHGNDLIDLILVARVLGKKAEDHRNVRSFITAMLSEDTAPTSRDFAVWAATEWVHHVRQGDRSAQTCARVRELLDCCTSDSTRAFLAASLYSVVPRRLGIGPMSAEEHGLLRSLKPLFMSQGRGPAFIAALAGTLPHDWENLKPLLEQSLLELPPSELPAGIASLIDAIFWVVRDTNDVQSLPSGLNLWLLDQLMRAPDPTDLSDLDWHNMNKILDRLGRAPLTWLPGALKTRVAMEEAGTARLAISGDTRYPISHFVKPITASDRENLETRAVLKDLLGWLPNRGSVGYYLPQLLGDVDPDGILVPDLVASALQSSLSADEQQRLARIASRYPLGSLPWRAIAKPALNAVRRRSQEDRFRLYSALSEKGVVEWQSAIGEVPTLFRSAVEEAVRRRDEEQDADFRDFWDWMVDGAQAELRWHEERAQMETIA